MEKLINELDKIVRWPKKPSDKKKVIQFLSTKFEYERHTHQRARREVLSYVFVVGRGLPRQEFAVR